MVMRVAALQSDVVVGDFDANTAKILEGIERARAAGADVVVTSELAITGYPPEDLLCKEGFIEDNLRALEVIARAATDLVAVVGYVAQLERASDAGPSLHNAAALCTGGVVVATYAKRCLPNYAVFDEVRWFAPGPSEPVLFEIAGANVGISICEDVWVEDGPVCDLGAAGAQLILNLNASPYSRGRRDQRLSMLERRVAQSGAGIVYVNQVGGQDELVFDGSSLFLDASGRLVASGAQFEEAFIVCDVEVGPRRLTSVEPIVLSAPRSHEALDARSEPAVLDPVGEVYHALVLGTRDYIEKNGFPGALLGLSGGIDSAIVATIAVDAIGPERVRAFALPSRYSSEGSTSDAQAVARRLGIELDLVSIESAHVALAEMLARALGHEPKGLTDENLQSRIRGLALMAVSNDTGWIVLTTGNKSEMATGYSTLYGDSAGGFAVIKDCPKTLVYELCRHRNAAGAARGEPEPIPESILDKAPSAELRPDQRDDQSLPPYDVLDPVLAAYVESDLTVRELLEAGFEPEVVERVASLVDRAEYKRRQMPPGVRITTKAFGKDRRMPITNHYGRG